MTDKKYWYALQKREDDNDWGTGTYDKDEAIRIAKEDNFFRIAVIDEGIDPLGMQENNDPLCVNELINGEDF
jgi:hypothetical protein